MHYLEFTAVMKIKTNRLVISVVVMRYTMGKCMLRLLPLIGKNTALVMKSFQEKKKNCIINVAFSFLGIPSPQRVKDVFETIKGKLRRPWELCGLEVERGRGPCLFLLAGTGGERPPQNKKELIGIILEYENFGSDVKHMAEL